MIQIINDTHLYGPVTFLLSKNRHIEMTKCKEYSEWVKITYIVSDTNLNTF